LNFLNYYYDHQAAMLAAGQLCFAADVFHFSWLHSRP